jgi:hypothetical protein
MSQGTIAVKTVEISLTLIKYEIKCCEIIGKKHGNALLKDIDFLNFFSPSYYLK